MFFFTLYSLGLRLGEGLALTTVADIDAARRRVHIRAGKRNKDRFVLPAGDDARCARDPGDVTAATSVVPRISVSMGRGPRSA